MFELTYDTEPMAAEADPHLIERYGRRPDGGRRADTMTGHDTAALDADRDERSPDVLGRLEVRMAQHGLRAHIYLTQRTVVDFARRRKGTDRPLERNVGRSWSNAFWQRSCVPRRNRGAGSRACTPLRRGGIHCRRRRCGTACPRGDRGHGQPGSVRGRWSTIVLSAETIDYPTQEEDVDEHKGAFDVRGPHRQAAEAEDRRLNRPSGPHRAREPAVASALRGRPRRDLRGGTPEPSKTRARTSTSRCRDRTAATTMPVDSHAADGTGDANRRLRGGLQNPELRCGRAVERSRWPPRGRGEPLKSPEAAAAQLANSPIRHR